MRKVMDKLMNAISFIIGLLLFAAVVLVVVQIFFRYVFRHPLGWSNQLCQLMYVWIVLLGLPVLFHKKAVTAFDYFSSKLSERSQHILHVFVCLFSMFFAVCFIVFSWQFMMKKGGMMIPAFRVIPYYTVYASMPVSGIILFLELLLQLIETIQILTGKKEDK